MIERGEDLGFTLKTRHTLSITSERLGQDFDGYIASELRIAGTVDFTHSARTYRSSDLVRPDFGSWRHFLSREVQFSTTVNFVGCPEVFADCVTGKMNFLPSELTSQLA